MTQQLLMVGTAIGTIAGLPIVFQFAKNAWSEKNTRNMIWGGAATLALGTASFWYFTQYWQYAGAKMTMKGEGSDHRHYNPKTRSFEAPAPPSTSGRTFLPEQQVLGLLANNGGKIFSIQFEKRDGTLRNMTARTGVYRGPGGEGSRLTGEGMKYDPTDYQLRGVFDLERDQYRMIGTDRVTRITIGGRTYRSSSAQ